MLDLCQQVSEVLRFLKRKASQLFLRLCFEFIALEPFIFLQEEQCIAGKRRSRKCSDLSNLYLEVRINIYGDGKLGSNIGRYLTHHELYLQHPAYPRAGLLYKNPHFLTDQNDEPIITKHTASGGVQIFDETDFTFDGVVLESNETVPSMFDKIFEDTDLEYSEPNPAIIKTTLKRYVHLLLWFQSFELFFPRPVTLAPRMGIVKS